MIDRRWKIYRSISIALALLAFLLGGFTASMSAAQEFLEVASPDSDAAWRSLFDGKTLEDWVAERRHDFVNAGKVEVRDGAITIGQGKPGSCARFTGEFPSDNYELQLKARRVLGDDFFCGMTFPVGKGALTLICGGWNGEVVGLSCLDGEPAAENETTDLITFERGRWYDIRVRTAGGKVQVWIDGRQIIDLTIGTYKTSLWFEKETVLPLSVATWRTEGQIKDIRIHKVTGPVEKATETTEPPSDPKSPKSKNKVNWY